jgi:hypothetical protein
MGLWGWGGRRIGVSKISLSAFHILLSNLEEVADNDYDSRTQSQTIWSGVLSNLFYFYGHSEVGEV